MTAPLVVCDHATRTFRIGSGLVTAVVGLDLAVPAGARWVVTGPSGSGKSTVLHLLAGLDRPTSGSVDWPALGGRRPRGGDDVGLVFQGASLVAHLDAVENVAFPLQIAGVPDREAFTRARAALDRLGLGALARSLPDRMSGGQAQRVAIARVLAAQPALILADEPTGQLDSATAHSVVDTLLAAADDTGAALVVSTHDPAVASRFSTRWRMSAGHWSPDLAPVATAGGIA